eukprot:GHRR01036072.1.p2 GENE.GHRR01036072.1~~GHRR01036072.1.p2  ORF type:complete len:124 (+),score=33.44 GHRR01036072.1:143-514(+)
MTTMGVLVLVMQDDNHSEAHFQFDEATCMEYQLTICPVVLGPMWWGWADGGNNCASSGNAAWKQVKSRLPGADKCRYGSSAMHAALQQGNAQLSLKAHVACHGALGSGECRALLQNCNDAAKG